MNNSVVKNIYDNYSPLMSSTKIKELITSYLPDFHFSDNIREDLNTLVLNYYCNEAVIKASFINNVLSKKTRSISFFEMPVNESRVDICSIGRISTAYEIKTDLDNVYRLSKQLNDYMKVFDKVYIICSEKRAECIESDIDPVVGIYTFKYGKYNQIFFKLYRRALPSNKLSSFDQLRTITKNELLRYFTCCDIQNNEKQKIISTILANLNNKSINRMFKKILKNRYEKKWHFITNNKNRIIDIDYQFFFNNNVNPNVVYF